MTTNLLESITKQLTPDMVQRVSTIMGETPVHTQKAVDGAISTLLAGLIYLSSTGTGPTQLVDLINHRDYGRRLNSLSGLLDEGHTAQTLMASGRDILSTLFAGKLSVVSELIAAASGVTSASASSLLSLTAPAVVGVLGRIRAAQGLTATDLAMLLVGQKDDISRLAPPGLAGIFGLSNIAELGSGFAGAVTEMTPDTVRDESRLKKWRWPVLAVVTLGLLYFLVQI
jgi:Bacterial protein of unknown function (DUF937)